MIGKENPKKIYFWTVTGFKSRTDYFDKDTSVIIHVTCSLFSYSFFSFLEQDISQGNREPRNEMEKEYLLGFFPIGDLVFDSSSD